MKSLYFDNHTSNEGTVSAPHRQGQKLLSTCEKAYKQLYEVCGASDHHTFVFTASGAEAINQIAFSTYLEIAKKRGKNHFVTSMIDEAPQVMAFSRLKQEFGCEFSMASVSDKGVVTVEAIAQTITPNTALVSLSWASGLTGVIHPISDIASLCRERGILFHVDASHVIGKLELNFDASGYDFLTFNGDHIGAPKGSGGLFVKQAVPLSPLILGGSEQGGYRGGSLDVPNLKALADAMVKMENLRDHFGTEIAHFKGHFERRLKKEIPGCCIMFEQTQRLPHISCPCFPRVSGEALAFILNDKEVYASFGGGQMQQISHILQSSQISDKQALCALSFGFSSTQTKEEIDQGVDRIIEAYNQLAKTSRYLEDFNES